MKRLYLIETCGNRLNQQHLQRVVFSYRSWLVKIYSVIRFSIIPLRFLEEIIQYVPERGKVLDLGCGFGLFSLVFARSKPDVSFMGIDLSASRINMAQASAEKLGLRNVTFEAQDIRNLRLSSENKYDVVLSMDILHHISENEGNEIIKVISKEVLKPGGLLILKEVNTRPRPMVWFTFILDLLMNPKDTFYYRDIHTWKEKLYELGFENVSEHYLWDILPYPHIMLVAQTNK